MAGRRSGVVAQLRQILGWVGVCGIFGGTATWDDEAGGCYVEDLVCIGECGVCRTREGIFAPDVDESPGLARGQRKGKVIYLTWVER